MGKHWARFDWWLLISALTIFGLGLATILSTDTSASGALEGSLFIKQAIWGVVGLALLLACSFIDYQFLRHLALPLFIFFLLLLFAMLFFASERNATQAWLGLSIFGVRLGIQPSEFTKIAYILFLAAFLDNYRERHDTFSFFLAGLAITLLPAGLIVLQGDLGTALVFFPVFLCMAAVAGVRWQLLVYLVLFAALTCTLLILFVWAPYSTSSLWQLTRILVTPRLFALLIAGLLLIILLSCSAWLLSNLPQFRVNVYLLSNLLCSLASAKLVYTVLPDYMGKRLLALVSPELYPLSSGWNVIQSIRAIGSGGLSGKGFREGILARYGYLPTQSQSTDFLFAVLGEELGLVGCLILFLAFGLLIARLLYITLSAPDHFSALFTVGMAGFFFFHFVQNVGMNLGLMPVMGIPLLLFSYGGSSLMSSLAGLGIVCNIASARHP